MIMDIIIFIVKWYILGIIALVLLTFIANKILSNEVFHTSVEDLIEVLWWSWLGVLIFILAGLFEFLDTVKIPNNLRKFYEAKETDE